MSQCEIIGRVWTPSSIAVVATSVETLFNVLVCFR